MTESLVPNSDKKEGVEPKSAEKSGKTLKSISSSEARIAKRVTERATFIAAAVPEGVLEDDIQELDELVKEGKQDASEVTTLIHTESIQQSAKSDNDQFIPGVEDPENYDQIPLPTIKIKDLEEPQHPETLGRGRHHTVVTVNYKGKEYAYRMLMDSDDPQLQGSSRKEVLGALLCAKQIEGVNKELAERGSNIQFHTVEPHFVVNDDNGVYSGSLSDIIDNESWSVTYPEEEYNNGSAQEYYLLLNRWQELQSAGDTSVLNTRLAGYKESDVREFELLTQTLEPVYKPGSRNINWQYDGPLSWDKIHELRSKVRSIEFWRLVQDKIETDRVNTVAEALKGAEILVDSAQSMVDSMHKSKKILNAIEVLEEQGLSIDTFGDNVLVRRNPYQKHDAPVLDVMLIDVSLRDQEKTPPVK